MENNILNTIRSIVNSRYADTLDSHQLLEYIIDQIYDDFKGDITTLILNVDNAKKKRQLERINKLEHGLLNSIHNMSISIKLSEHLKTKKGKLLFNILYGDDGDNIPMFIPIMMAHFPDAKIDRHSESEKKWFNYHLNIFMKHKNKYVDGDSMDWAKTMGYYDYMVKLVDNNIKEESDDKKNI